MTTRQNAENILADLDRFLGLDPGNRAYEEAIEQIELVVKTLRKMIQELGIPISYKKR